MARSRKGPAREAILSNYEGNQLNFYPMKDLSAVKWPSEVNGWRSLELAESLGKSSYMHETWHKLRRFRSCTQRVATWIWIIRQLTMKALQPPSRGSCNNNCHSAHPQKPQKNFNSKTMKPYWTFFSLLFRLAGPHYITPIFLRAC